MSLWLRWRRRTVRHAFKLNTCTRSEQRHFRKNSLTGFWNFLKNDTRKCLLRKVERLKKDYVGLFCERNVWPKALYKTTFSIKTSRKFRINSVVKKRTEFEQKTACIPTMRFRSLFRNDESLKKVKQKDQTTIPQPYEIFYLFTTGTEWKSTLFLVTGMFYLLLSFV